MISAPRPSSRGASRRRLCNNLAEDLVKMPAKAIILSSVVLLAGGAWWLSGQDAKNPVFRTKVDLVVLSFTVSDNKGHYINNLKPCDFRSLEHGIVAKISTFAEGNKPAAHAPDHGTLPPSIASSRHPSQPATAPRQHT